MIEIISFQLEEHPELAEKANKIRQEVFVQEQNVDPELEYDEYESQATHYLLSVDGKPACTARWRKTERGIKLERFATLSAFRNSGLGEMILKRVLEDTIPYRREIYLHSQLKAIPFYERHGFEKVGEMFSEAEIEHFEMILRNNE